jgi:leucyl/phenylalanyl-tRNA--protein transferase
MLLPVPIEPPPNRWNLPAAEAADEREICGVGADLEPGTRSPRTAPASSDAVGPQRRPGWWSPDPRGVILLDGMYGPIIAAVAAPIQPARINTAFEAVMRAPIPSDRMAGLTIRSWTPTSLHHLGAQHRRSGTTVNGRRVYGASIGGLLAGSRCSIARCVEGRC